MITGYLRQAASWIDCLIDGLERTSTFSAGNFRKHPESISECGAALPLGVGSPGISHRFPTQSLVTKLGISWLAWPIRPIRTGRSCLITTLEQTTSTGQKIDGF